MVGTRFVFQARYGFGQVVTAMRRDVDHLELAAQAEWRHYVVLKYLLRHKADPVARADPVALLDERGEFPFLVVLQRLQVHAALQEEAALLGKLRQGVLESIVYLAQ